MIDVLAWAGSTLLASTVLMLLVLTIRAPVRRWVGPQLGYGLWAIPALRMVLPSIHALPAPILDKAAPMSVLFAGPRGLLAPAADARASMIGAIMLFIWLGGAIALFAVLAVRHMRFSQRLRATATGVGQQGAIRILAADVAGPLAFGVFQRFIAVPRTFGQDYDAREQALALAHELAHHARGDLLANWASLLMLAMHWWNPLAWIAIRAFAEDQELAVDARVLAGCEADALPLYARVLAKASGVALPPACNLHGRSTLKRRLMALAFTPRPGRRIAVAALALAGGTALAASATTVNPPAMAQAAQATTIIVKPDGTGVYALLIDGEVVAAHGPLPHGMTLPADFADAGGCDLRPTAKPRAMAIKETDRTLAYTVMCASAAPESVYATLGAGLASLRTMRNAIATQPATASFPETERAHALGITDRSIRDLAGRL